MQGENIRMKVFEPTKPGLIRLVATESRDNEDYSNEIGAFSII